jgi:hypothetical protein
MVNFLGIVDHGYCLTDTGSFCQRYVHRKQAWSILLMLHSRNVRFRTALVRFWYSFLHHCRLIADGRTRLSERTTHHDISFQCALVCRVVGCCRSGCICNVYKLKLMMVRYIIRYTVTKRRLGMEDTINTPNGAIFTSDHLYIVNVLQFNMSDIY